LQKNYKIFLLLFAFVSGCGLFSTRDVELPNTPRSNFIPPTTPDIVITNFTSAIFQRDINNYTSCISDSNFGGANFKYIPDVISQGTYPVFASWDKNKENSYFTNIVNQTSEASTSNLFLSNVTSTVSTDSAVYDSDYLLIFNHNRANVARQAKGKLRFVITHDSRNLWAIKSWTDFRVNDTDTTWSIIKANFAN
jgi:hypothetical protein